MITETRDAELHCPHAAYVANIYLSMLFLLRILRGKKKWTVKKYTHIRLGPSITTQLQAPTKMSEKTHAKNKNSRVSIDQPTNRTISIQRHVIFFVHSFFYFSARCFKRHVLVYSCTSYTAMHNMLPHLMLLINFRLFYCFVGPSFI